MSCAERAVTLASMRSCSIACVAAVGEWRVVVPPWASVSQVSQASFMLMAAGIHTHKSASNREAEDTSRCSPLTPTAPPLQATKRTSIVATAAAHATALPPYVPPSTPGARRCVSSGRAAMPASG